jgi:hypothetical protein
MERYGALPGSALAEIERVLALVLDIGAGG